MVQEQFLFTPHAGEMLKDFIADTDGLNATKLARAVDIAPKRLYAVINGTQAVNDDIDENYANIIKYRKARRGLLMRGAIEHCAMQSPRAPDYTGGNRDSAMQSPRAPLNNDAFATIRNLV